jgi:hypothetical protein
MDPMKVCFGILHQLLSDRSSPVNTACACTGPAEDGRVPQCSAMAVVDGVRPLSIFMLNNSVDMHDRSSIAAAWPHLMLMLTRPTDQQ